MWNLCPECRKKLDAAIAAGKKFAAFGIIIVGCTHGLDARGVEHVRHDHPPEKQIRMPMFEPPVAQVTSANTTITPGTGSIGL